MGLGHPLANIHPTNRLRFNCRCRTREHSLATAKEALKAVEHIKHAYEVRPRKDKRGVNLISDVLPFGRLWYAGPDAVANAIGYARHYSRSHGAVIRVYDESGSVIETHGHKVDFKE